MVNYKPVSGPFSHSENSSVRIMYLVLFALLPATAFGVFQFGLNSLVVLLSCCIACVGFELVCLLIMRKEAIACLDGSALLTGWLLAMSLPPSVPVWICVVGSAFAIVVGKQIYGGLGQNLFNPAMLARVMLLICFPVEMTIWSDPTAIDFSSNQISIPEAWLNIDGTTSATQLANSTDNVIATVKLLIGQQSGCMGETSTLLILLGGLFLIYRGVIHWAIPATFLFGLGFPALISSAIAPDQFHSVSTHLFSGGAMFAAFFILTDLVTSPTSVKGQIVYGLSCGLLVWLIRCFGSYPEGVAFAVLIMNATSPLIDHYFRPKIFGSQSLV